MPNPQTSEYAARCARSIGTSCRVRVNCGRVEPDFFTPGSIERPGITGSAALSIIGSAAGWPFISRVVGSVLGSGPHHLLAADPDHVAIDRGRGRVGVPDDRLGDVDRETTLGHRICLLYTSPSPRDRTRSRM